jgi:hypothetical protein
VTLGLFPAPAGRIEGGEQSSPEISMLITAGIILAVIAILGCVVVGVVVLVVAVFRKQ